MSTDELDKSTKSFCVPPFEVRLSDQVVAKYGFRDARVEVTIQLPKPFSTFKKSVTLKLTPEEVRHLKGAAEKAVLWESLPDYQRQRDGAE